MRYWPGDRAACGAGSDWDCVLYGAGFAVIKGRPEAHRGLSEMAEKAPYCHPERSEGSWVACLLRSIWRY